MKTNAWILLKWCIRYRHTALSKPSFALSSPPPGYSWGVDPLGVEQSALGKPRNARPNVARFLLACITSKRYISNLCLEDPLATARFPDGLVSGFGTLCPR